MASRTVWKPTCLDELVDVICEAVHTGTKVALCGGGSKGVIGAPTHDVQLLDMRGLTGVVDYDPSELVLTVRAGTPLSQVCELVSGQGQMLAFDPFEYGPIWGKPNLGGTIGGTIAAGMSGSLRLTQGAARDHVLGLEAVSGRGERFVAGAKVIKNVTGYDLPKLLTGSWGRLAAITQVTLKVLPRPRTRATKMIVGLNPAIAVRVMAKALASHAEVSAAAYLPTSTQAQGASLTAMRVQGFAQSVEARCSMLDDLLAEYGPVASLDEERCTAFWRDIATLSPIARDRALWRIHVPPSRAPMLIERLQLASTEWFLDWAGGLIWVLFDGHPEVIRNAAAGVAGHATLLRAPEPIRRVVSAFHPQTSAVAGLEWRVRRAFDPAGIFETGRF